MGAQISRSIVRMAAAALAVAAGLTASAAHAGDRIHEDSFGNLIVQSPSGYKRIVVGKGYLAARLGGESYSAATRREPSVIYYGDRGSHRDRRAYRSDCNRQPVLLHGRSYMYGLDDNVVPVPAGLCR